jgi:inhibitor of cysteine peptidase
MGRRFAVTGRVAASLVVLLAACESMPPMKAIENPFDPPPVAVRVGESAAAAPVVLQRGQTLVITLEANVTTGYRWVVANNVAPTLVTLGTPDYRTTVGTPPGAPGDMTFRFRGDAPGSATLELAYRRPFEPDVAPARTVRYDVTVR